MIPDKKKRMRYTQHGICYVTPGMYRVSCVIMQKISYEIRN